MPGDGEPLEDRLDALRALEEDVRAAVPPHLLASLLDTALEARRPVVPAAAPGTAEGALVEASEALDADLASLTPAEWQAAALVGWMVRDVVGHLAAVHEVLAPRLTGLTDAPITLDELAAATERTIDELRRATVGETRDRWCHSVRRLQHGLAVCDTEVSWLGLVVPAAKVIADRAFETWIHANDIRLATGRPSVDPSGANLHVLCDLAVELLPLGLLLTERPHDALVTVHLHGDGGGTWTMPLGSGAESGVMLAFEAPARELCLLMGDRLDPADLRWTVHGGAPAEAIVRDLALAAPVFARP